MFGAIRLSSLRLLGECVPSLEEKVTQIVVDQLGVEASEVSPKSSFVEDLGADSLDRVELVMALEEAFAVEITDEQAEKIATVQDAVDYRSEEHTSELQSHLNLVCRLLLEKKKRCTVSTRALAPSRACTCAG